MGFILVPVIAGALVYGTLGGVVTVLVVSPLTLLEYRLIGVSLVGTGPALALGTVVALLVGGSLGAARNLKIRVEEREMDFVAFADNLPGVLFVNDSEERLVFGNRRHRELYGPGALPGAPIKVFLPPEEADEIIEENRRVLREGRTVINRKELIDPLGNRRIMRLIRFPIYRSLGVWLGGIAVDITDQAEAEEKLKRLVEDKDMLLKEVHHRVKNNLLMMRSLIDMECSREDTIRPENVCDEIKDKIQSIALVHDKLSRGDTVREIDMHEYIPELVETLLIDSERAVPVAGHYRIEEGMFDVDTAIPLGLMIAELTINVLKYAFPPGRVGACIEIVLRRVDSDIFFSYRDNGVGLPEGIVPEETDSLGLKLIRSLAEQLGGTAEFTSGPDGTMVICRLRPYTSC